MKAAFILWLTRFVHFKPCLWKVCMSMVLSYIVETSLLSLCVAGIHRRSLHHSQSQEEGKGKERKGGGEDGSGEWKCTTHFISSIVFTPFYEDSVLTRSFLHRKVINLVLFIY